ncbi:gp19 [Shigella virus Moo19]|uniref:Uncharacterized protein n=1 Tax=Shigella virus Moo19 TaxID=2886042 RepID=A0AAE8YCL4_9CAUD|nr:gp19 [Shigella virus Moo19]UEN68815.1 hypothetical protein Moo19_gp19 [Shigella virus Moo19]
MKVITYPTHKIALYMGQKVEVPLWVKYLAVLPMMYGHSSSALIGFSHKPKFTKTGIWKISSQYKNTKQEQIGIVRNFAPAKNEIEATLSEVLLP